MAVPKIETFAEHTDAPTRQPRTTRDPSVLHGTDPIALNAGQKAGRFFIGFLLWWCVSYVAGFLMYLTRLIGSFLLIIGTRVAIDVILLVVLLWWFAPRRRWVAYGIGVACAISLVKMFAIVWFIRPSLYGG